MTSETLSTCLATAADIACIDPLIGNDLYPLLQVQLIFFFMYLLPPTSMCKMLFYLRINIAVLLFSQIL